MKFVAKLYSSKLSQNSLPNSGRNQSPVNGLKAIVQNTDKVSKLNTSCQHYFLLGLLSLPDRNDRLYPTHTEKQNGLNSVVTACFKCDFGSVGGKKALFLLNFVTQISKRQLNSPHTRFQLTF